MKWLGVLFVCFWCGGYLYKFKWFFLKGILICVIVWCSYVGIDNKYLLVLRFRGYVVFYMF